MSTACSTCGPDIDLETRITAGRFDPEARRWELTATPTSNAGGTNPDTAGGTEASPVERTYRCRHLLLCTGFGSAPYVPPLPGLDSFAGLCHHTARWPEAGGVVRRPARGHHRYRRQRGTGRAEEAARDAAEVVVFQRSPVTALPMVQRQLDPAAQAEAKTDYPALFERRNRPPGSFADIDRLDVGALEVSDEERRRVFQAAWEQGGFHFWVGTFNDILTSEAANRTAYDFWRDQTRARIDDPGVAELLAPTDPPYPFGTKRPSLEQGYYECFNQPNVHLVDLLTNPIEAITPGGVQTTTGEVALDVLVLATGFDANTGGLTAIDLRVEGGPSLAEAWVDGVDTHLGVAVAGFPNLLFLYGPQSATAFCNGPVCAELQGDWVVELLDHLRRHGHTLIDSEPDMGPRWSAHLAELADSTLFGRADSWYMGANIPGKRRQLLNYPNSDAYLDHLRRCAADDYRGFIFD